MNADNTYLNSLGDMVLVTQWGHGCKGYLVTLHKEGESGEARQQWIVVGSSVESHEELLFLGGEDNGAVVPVGATGAGGGLETGQRAGDGVGGDVGRRGGRVGADCPETVAPAAPENGGEEDGWHSGEFEVLGGDDAGFIQLTEHNLEQLVFCLIGVFGGSGNV